MILNTGNKIRLAFITPTIVTLLALGLFEWFISETGHDNSFINIAGSQRKLSRDLLTFSNMVRIGQEEDKRELSETVAAFDANLELFVHGGQWMQRYLPPLPVELAVELAAVGGLWRQIRPRLERIIEAPAGSASGRDAYRGLAEDITRLGEVSQQLVEAYERRSEKLRKQMLYSLAVVVLLTLLSAIMGAWVVRRYTNEQQHIKARLQREKEEQEQLVQQLRDAQAQLFQSEKLASIGQLAAGVAHEINNPVGYISSNIGSLKQALDDLFKLLGQYEEAEETLGDDAVRQRIQATKQEIDLAFLKDDLKDLISESQEGVGRVKRIVQDLKEFAHMEEDDWQRANLHSGLDSTLNIVNNEIKYRADVIKAYGDIPEVECILPQLNQVFMNLLVNAAHAIEERGTITIRTGVEGESVWVSVEDTGKGMDAATQKKIFDPFFTTKGVGKGTGLGLSLSYNIIQKHNGSIEVESTPGKGTVFRIRLPVTQPGGCSEPD